VGAQAPGRRGRVHRGVPALGPVPQRRRRQGRSGTRVGAGNSGWDRAGDAAHDRLDVSISIRRGQAFQPKAIFGRPRAELGWLAKLPPTVQERVTRALFRIVVGAPEVYRGLPVPATRNLNDQPPVVNSLLLYWIQHGRITVVPGIAAIEGQTVRFTDGTAKEFDTILWATGFRTALPFLDPSMLRWQDGVPLRVAGLTAPVGVERLWFVGLAAPRGPQLPVYSAQSRLVWNKQMAGTARIVAALEKDSFEKGSPETKVA
jgi:cation diffusion facilitator CzcD-associated flavoprotein CzcO